MDIKDLEHNKDYQVLLNGYLCTVVFQLSAGGDEWWFIHEVGDGHWKEIYVPLSSVVRLKEFSYK